MQTYQRGLGGSGPSVTGPSRIVESKEWGRTSTAGVGVFGRTERTPGPACRPVSGRGRPPRRGVVHNGELVLVSVPTPTRTTRGRDTGRTLPSGPRRFRLDPGESQRGPLFLRRRSSRPVPPAGNTRGPGRTTGVVAGLFPGKKGFRRQPLGGPLFRRRSVPWSLTDRGEHRI